ncbi:MAG: hypothetical protein ABSD85_07020 [Acidimicrobiales bacterium]
MGRPVIDRGGPGGGIGLPERPTGRGAAPGIVGAAAGTEAVTEDAGGAAATGWVAPVGWGAPDAGAAPGRLTDGVVAAPARWPEGAVAGLTEPGAVVLRGAPGGGGIAGRGAEARGASTSSLADLLTTRR